MLRLETTQAERFAWLFDGLIDYVHARLKERGSLDVGVEDDRDKLMHACHDAIWGEGGDTSLIDCFVEEGPLGLDEADRETVLSWKEGIYRIFPVLCENDAMRFILGDRVFVVRGSVMDIFDFMETIPGSLLCVILPFDGCVTVGTWMLEAGDGLPHYIENSCHDISFHNERNGTTISTAERFLDEAPGILASMRLAEGKLSASRQEEGVPSAAEHRGALAGLGWQEREEALKERRAQAAGTDAIALVKASCVKSLPRSIDTAVKRLKRDDLDEFSRAQRLYRDISYMNKKEAADYVASNLTVGATLIVEDVMRRGGPHLIEGFRDLTLAGGRLSVADTDADAVRNLPLTCEPYLYLTHRGGCYQASLIGEVYEVLAVVDWWDEALGQARRVDAAIRAIESQASFRGIISVGDVEDAIAGLAEDGEVSLVLDVLRYRGQHGMASCRLVQEWFTGGRFVADVDAGGPTEAYYEALMITPWVKDMLAFRGDIPPRDMFDVEPGQSVFDWMRNRRSYRDLVAFLDEHVPNGDDDYAFADEVATHLVDEARRAVHYASIPGFCNMVLKDTEITDDVQVQRLQTLVTEVVYDVPRWLLNGWSDWERRG